MGLRDCKFGTKKGFLFTMMTSVILLVLFALLYVYMQVHAPASNNYLLSEQVNSIASQISKAQQTMNQLNYSRNSTNYFISEVFSQNKKATLDSNKNYLASILKKLSNQTTANISFSSINYGDFILFSNNFNYSWNYSSKKLKIDGDYSKIKLFFNNSPQLISDNCTSTGGTANLIINSIFNKMPQGYCIITLNITNKTLTIDYNEKQANISFSNITSSYFNVSLTTASTSKQLISESQELFSTTSTANPGWTEPVYPANTAPTKHYSSITLDSKKYNIIIIDLNSTAVYDAAYIDEDTDFTDGNATELATDNSKVFLNNNVFLLNIQQDGNAIKFRKLNAVHVQKNSIKANAPI